MPIGMKRGCPAPGRGHRSGKNALAFIASGERPEVTDMRPFRTAGLEG